MSREKDKRQKPGFFKKPGFSKPIFHTNSEQDVSSSETLCECTTNLFIYRYLYYLFLLILPITSCQQSKSDNQTLTPLPQDSSIQVYFNHSQTSEYQEPYREKIRKGDNLEKIIIDAITQAESTIDIAVQELRLPIIAQA